MDSYEKENAILRKILRVITHDLRGPFASLLMFTNELCDDLDEKERRACITQINANVRGLHTLIENLLSWSAIEKGSSAVRIVPLALRNEADLVCRDLETAAKKKSVELRNKIGKKTQVLSSGCIIHLILRNLITNALKYTPAGGWITLTEEPLNGHWTAVAVSDTGNGISPADLNKLLKSDQPISKTGINGEKGYGFGLLICQDMISRLGGNIQIKSELGKGTKVSFTLKLN